ncbi:MAG: hypothetical protein Q4C95_08115 [Planctomycetia bacterium]|nr:hypothetical protein [Planctomycetia bacterium]
MNLLALLGFQQIWLSIPLVIAFALVYAATRHEDVIPILKHALRIITWIFAFLILVFFILSFST